MVMCSVVWQCALRVELLRELGEGGGSVGGRARGGKEWMGVVYGVGGCGAGFGAYYGGDDNDGWSGARSMEAVETETGVEGEGWLFRRASVGEVDGGWKGNAWEWSRSLRLIYISSTRS